jgi:histidinol dehydrogenase
MAKSTFCIHFQQQVLVSDKLSTLEYEDWGGCVLHFSAITPPFGTCPAPDNKEYLQDIRKAGGLFMCVTGTSALFEYVEGSNSKMGSPRTSN